MTIGRIYFRRVPVIWGNCHEVSLGSAKLLLPRAALPILMVHLREECIG